MPATPVDRVRALAIHVCCDAITCGARRLWRPTLAARDTTARAQRICTWLGVVDQRTLAGDAATVPALLGALGDACASLADDGLLVLTFSGHTERGDGPIESARWCLVGGGLMLFELAAELARLPTAAELLVISDTCYASAVAQTLVGPQRATVLASCGDDQTMVDRPCSEFMARLEPYVEATGDLRAIDALRNLLAADTPDCEQPVVWCNTASSRIAARAG